MNRHSFSSKYVSILVRVLRDGLLPPAAALALRGKGLVHPFPSSLVPRELCLEVVAEVCGRASLERDLSSIQPVGLEAQVTHGEVLVLEGYVHLEVPLFPHRMGRALRLRLLQHVL